MTGLRDRLLAEGMPNSEYFKLENHTFSPGLGIRSQAKNIPVPRDIYESGKLENEVRKDGKKFLNKHAYIPRTIYTGGIPLSNGKLGTNPAIGILDCLVSHPIKRQAFFVEWKANEGGKLSPDQQNFIFDMESCGIRCFVITSALMLEAVMKVNKLIE